MKKQLLLSVFTMLLRMTFAQSPLPSEPIRFIKLANTLRAVNQFDEAEKILQKYIPVLQGRDLYWEAVAYENLGLINRDQHEDFEAARNFQKALEIYSKLKMDKSKRAIEQLLQGVSGQEEVYAGIDIGSKGIKLSLIAVHITPKNGIDFKIRPFPTRFNVETSALTDQAIQETAQAVKILIDSATVRRKVPAERIFVALSSGLKQFIDQKPDKEQILLSAIRTALNNPSFPIPVISPEDEAKYAFQALFREEKYIWSMMDIGGGNVKGGYLDKKKPFEAVNFSYGTKTFSRVVNDMNTEASIVEYGRNAERLIAKFGEEIYLEMSRKAGLRTRKQVLLNGGIVFIINTYMHPERATQVGGTFITPADVKRFREMAIHQYEQLIHPDLSRITDPLVREAAEKDVLEAEGIKYDQKALIAGATVLDTLMKEYTKGSIAKSFAFVKGADVAWISGYVFELIKNDYAKKIEQ